MAKIRYGPCTNWGQKKSTILFGTRQYVLEEAAKWTNLGRFAGDQEGREELMGVTKRAQAKASISQQYGEVVFTWPRTQEEMDQMYPDKETLVVDGEEAVARVMGLLVEGTWLKEEAEETGEEEADERPDTPTLVEKNLVKPSVETIESLSQSLSMGSRTSINEDVNMVDITGTEESGTSGAKEGEKVEGGGGGLDKSIHAVGGGEEKKGKGKAKAAEEEKKSKESQGWRHYPMYDDRTLDDMMRVIIGAAAAMVEAKEKGIKGSAYQDWVEVTN